MFKFKNIFELAKNDFRSRYAGNYLGVFWAFVYPCITVILYWFVFQIILKSGDGQEVPYILWLVSALVPYLFFCDCLSGTVSVLVDYSYLVKKVRFDLRVLPVVRIISYVFIHVFFVVLLLILSVILGYSFKLGDLWLIYYVAAELVFVTAFGYLLSALSVFFRDIRNIISVFIQIGYWLTPIFWDINSTNYVIKCLIRIINPICYVTEGFRSAVLNGTVPNDFLIHSLYFWSISILFLIAGIIIFSRMKTRFADYI